MLHPIQVVEAPFGVLTATGIDGSTDGRYLYITDQDDQSLVVLARDPASSELQFVEVQSGFGGTPFAVALSPDDAYVYVTWSDFGYPESGITIFTRNQETGRLTRSGGNRLTGRSLYEPVDIAISSDGNGAYVAANGNDEIAIFQRNATTGALTYRESLLNNQNGLNRLENPRSLVISPDNAYIYVASFGNSTINVFARNVDTNALTLVEMQSESVTGVTGLGELQAISISNDGTQIYVVSNASALTVFQRNAVTGKLTFQQQFRDGKAGVRGLVGRKTVNISQDDTNVYVYSKGYTSPIAQTAVVRFQRNLTTGALTFTNVYTATESAMISSHTQQLEIFLPADGRQLYTSHVDGMDRLDRDPNNGTLFRQPTVMLAFPIPRAPTLDPYSLTTPALSPDGRHLYVPGWGESIASARDDTLSVFQRDATTGEVTPIQVIRDTERSYPLHSAVAAIVSPDGQFVYATGYWGKITRYARNSTTGMLTYLNVYDYTNRTPSLIGFNQLLISPDGKHLYVALSRYSSNDWEAAIGVFTRDLITGALKLVEVKQTNLSPVADFDGVSGLTISPDGKHVYATNYLGNSLTVLQRDPDTGRLTLVTAYYDNANGMDGLDGAAGVTVSADGAYVYVVGGFDKSITLLSRDPTTGVLTLINLTMSH